MMVDTLTIARELKAAELPPAQAEAIAAAIGRSVAEGSATKADLEGQRLALKGDIDAVRAATKADIDDLRAATKADLDAPRAATKADLEQLRTELQKDLRQLLIWLMSALVALAGVIIAVVKL